MSWKCILCTSLWYLVTFYNPVWCWAFLWRTVSPGYTVEGLTWGTRKHSLRPPEERSIHIGKTTTQKPNILTLNKHILYAGLHNDLMHFFTVTTWCQQTPAHEWFILHSKSAPISKSDALCLFGVLWNPSVKPGWIQIIFIFFIFVIDVDSWPPSTVFKWAL